MRVVPRGYSAKAVEHLDRGDGETRVAPRENSGFVRLAITDDGPGIPEEHRESVFGITALKSHDRLEDLVLAWSRRERLSNALAARSGLKRHRLHEAYGRDRLTDCAGQLDAAIGLEFSVRPQARSSASNTWRAPKESWRFENASFPTNSTSAISFRQRPGRLSIEK